MSPLFISFLILQLYVIENISSKSIVQRSNISWEEWITLEANENDRYQYQPKNKKMPKSLWHTPTNTNCNTSNCMEMIKVDQQKHFKFLLEILNRRFGEDTQVKEGHENPGPIRINISLRQEFITEVYDE
ncbi:hypothetical protein WA026_011011 [Henosepilachna vigintioctopunctata]|uniref:Uncharacterized protein n=1 Tax=Henosepilachna vigintioctopunctata TaxID=420089 RepID=A0AAW1URS8_9CUCU